MGPEVSLLGLRAFFLTDTCRTSRSTRPHAGRYAIMDLEAIIRPMSREILQGKESLAAVLAATLGLAGCGASADQVGSSPVLRTENFKVAPAPLSICFQSAYASQYPERVSFERRKSGDGINLYALQFGTADDLVLPKRYWWLLTFEPRPAGASVALRSLGDWAGIDHAGLEIWTVLESCG